MILHQTLRDEMTKPNAAKIEVKISERIELFDPIKFDSENSFH
jgi:hypothetical protein